MHYFLIKCLLFLWGAWADPLAKILIQFFLERSGVVYYVESAEQALDVLFGGKER